MRIALFAKKGKPTAGEVIKFLKENFDEAVIYEGTLGNVFPQKANAETYDIVISYMSPWIIPASVLKKTRMWNINFHPGPPEYPGIGCFNFAIYNYEKMYGVTSHLMEEKVDTGRIIGVKRFPVLESDTVLSLSLKSYNEMLLLFFETLNYILKNNKLPDFSESWARKPYTRRELELLCRVEPNMSKEELGRRIRATTYPKMPGAYIELFGYKFEYNPER